MPKLPINTPTSKPNPKPITSKASADIVAQDTDEAFVVQFIITNASGKTITSSSKVTVIWSIDIPIITISPSDDGLSAKITPILAGTGVLTVVATNDTNVLTVTSNVVINASTITGGDIKL